MSETRDHAISTERDTDDGTVKCIRCGAVQSDYTCDACERLLEATADDDAIGAYLSGESREERIQRDERARTKRRDR